LAKQPRLDDNDLFIDVETFVVGTMYHIDGFILNGEVKFVWPSRYVNTCVGFKENPFLASCSLSPRNPLTARLQQFAVDVVTRLDEPTNNGSYPFHCEAWHTPDDRIVLCEIG
jgi:hypothetical protein